ncbi:hypothetical protein CRE_16409 [Caenorhabditis remanei]|uniref:G-protein coupled receptors family 1 profile domain-containing protein n=1 Tax=Caenorhabditis remanei TaxID=31234 RepID=E3NC46_CAERE|nr:hypothetical protein CRE_16409 [Caenorhabditis remanei]
MILAMETEYLANYYKTVYSVNCTPDPRFLASKEGVIFYSRLIESISLPIQILTTFCILKKTPESMNYVKSSLLNVNICAILAGIVLSFFVTPFNYFPYLAGFTMGFAADLGASAMVQVIIGLAMTFVILISVMVLFENRSSLIARNRCGISKTSIRIAWVSVNFFGSLLLLVPIFLNLPDQMKAKLDILKALPCPAKEFFTEPTFVLAGEEFGKTYMIATVMFIYFNFLAQILLFFVCCVYYLFIFKISQLSVATRRLQIQSFLECWDKL